MKVLMSRVEYLRFNSNIKASFIGLSVISVFNVIKHVKKMIWKVFEYTSIRPIVNEFLFVHLFV